MNNSNKINSQEKKAIASQLEKLKALQNNFGLVALEKEEKIRNINFEFEQKYAVFSAEKNKELSILNNFFDALNKKYGNCKVIPATGEIIREKSDGENTK